MSVYDILNSSFIKWMDVPEGDRDIVISSRIRLARNLAGLPFPHLLDQKMGEKSLDLVSQAWKNTPGPLLADMDMISLDQLSALDKQILTEKHLSSPQHADATCAYRAILVNHDGSLAAMVNEEDHLRMQCLLPGLRLRECYAEAQALDDEFEYSLDYAFDEERGYLTACPTNVGTGLRASVMVHLPAMQISGQLNHVLQNIGQLGMAVRGLYGEGSQPVGNFYQISNQVTLGQTEEDICTYLQTVTEQIVEQESLLRERLKTDLKYQLEDKIGRAYGILCNARVIASDEALSLLSDVRLGVDLGTLTGISLLALNELMVAIRPAHLQKWGGREMDAIERDIKRAEVIQAKMTTVK